MGTKKYESTRGHESTLHCFVFDEFGGDRKLGIRAIDRRQIGQNRHSIRSVRGHGLIHIFQFLIVAHPPANATPSPALDEPYGARGFAVFLRRLTRTGSGWESGLRG